MSRPCLILIIDDDPNLCRTLALMLEHAGYAVAVANTGQQGLSCLDTGAYDLVLLDLGRGDKDGREWLPRLRQRCPHIPMLVLVGQDLSGLDKELQERGASAILTKPVDPELLLSRVWALSHGQDFANP